MKRVENIFSRLCRMTDRNYRRRKVDKKFETKKAFFKVAESFTKIFVLFWLWLYALVQLVYEIVSTVYVSRYETIGSMAKAPRMRFFSRLIQRPCDLAKFFNLDTRHVADVSVEIKILNDTCASLLHHFAFDLIERVKAPYCNLELKRFKTYWDFLFPTERNWFLKFNNCITEKIIIL